MKFSAVLMLVMLSISSFVSSSSTCLPRINPIVHHLKRQCPITIFPTWPIEIEGESIIKFWKSNGQNAYIAILFYASWCPFSMDVQPKFAALSSMYPQIHHVMVKHSSPLSLVFFVHRIHGVPSIVLVNRTTNLQHYGPKDLNSLLHFYQQSTGLDPVVYLTEDEINSFKSRPTVGRSWNQRSWKDMAASEPYLAYSLLFILLKILYVIALWVRYIPHLIPEIFGKSRQLLVDLKKAFSKPKVWNNRNLHKQQNWFPPSIA